MKCDTMTSIVARHGSCRLMAAVDQALMEVSVGRAYTRTLAGLPSHQKFIDTFSISFFFSRISCTFAVAKALTRLN